MKINGKIVKGSSFAFDGCHKIYILEDDEDLKNAKRLNYQVLPLEELERTFKNSCELRFINNWKLDKTYVNQFENASFN